MNIKNIKNIKIGNGWKTLGATISTGLVGEAIGKRLVKTTGFPKGGKLGVAFGIGAGILTGIASAYSTWAFDEVFGDTDEVYASWSLSDGEPVSGMENGD